MSSRRWRLTGVTEMIELQFCLNRSTVRLIRRFRSTQAFAVEPRAIEAANASFPRGEHRAGILNSARARLFLFGGGDPKDPISSRVGRDVRP